MKAIPQILPTASDLLSLFLLFVLGPFNFVSKKTFIFIIF